ncbi:Alanine--tRNA ligase, cytoplasmic [Lamellibrachia satsuma]|nr:Alanine--tRNA ligase, cytoplasmic [Lamellibrachia satsuma]
MVSLGVPVNELLTDPKSELGLQHSVELCGGSHVHNTGHLGALVVTNFLGITQGTKRVITMTGAPARQAIANGKRLRSQLDRLRQWTSTGQKRTLWVEEAQVIEKSLSGQDILLSKIDRDDRQTALQSLQINILSA